VTPRQVKKRLQGDGVEEEYFGREVWRFQGQEVGGALVAPGTVGQELRAAGEFANGVLEAGPAVVLHLGPEEGNTGEVLHVYSEAGEGGIGGFDRMEVVFATVMALRGSG